MLYSTNELSQYTLSATDDELGKCKDLLFNEEEWAVRYVVADSRRWLPGRKVLLSPISLGTPNLRNRQLPVNLTKEQVTGSPGLDEHAPVSRQFERELAMHYRYGQYWTGAALWGASAYPSALVNVDSRSATSVRNQERHSALRSVNEVSGYSIHTKDGSLGHVEEFLFDGLTWALQYLVVDTRNWIPGKTIAIPVAWISDVRFRDRAVRVDQPTSVVQQAPVYGGPAFLTPAFEETLKRFSHSVRPSQAVPSIVAAPGSRKSEQDIDETLKQSFPASDPPAY